MLQRCKYIFIAIYTLKVIGLEVNKHEYNDERAQSLPQQCVGV